MIDKINQNEANFQRREVKRPDRWKITLLLWVVLPALLAAILVAIGAHLGANGQDQWYTRLVIWFVGLF